MTCAGRVNPTIPLAALLALALAAAPALAAPYACTVAAFSTFSTDDTAFIAANKRKTYSLSTAGNTVTLTMRSPDFQGYTARYSLSRRDLLADTFQRDDRRGTDLLTLPPNPAARIAEEGRFEATLTVVGSHYTNSWRLACTAP